MNDNGNWLDLSSTSNRFWSTYTKGFIDISGGNVILRNNSIITTETGNLFLGGLIQQNTNPSILTRDISYTLIPSTLTFDDTYLPNNTNIFSASNTFSSGLVSNGPVNVQSSAIALSDSSLNGRLSVGKDSSFNGNLYVAQPTNVTGRIISLSDVSLNGRLFVGSDASFGQNVSIRGNITLPSSGTHSISGTLNIQTSICNGLSTVTGSETVTGNKTIGGNLVANGGLKVASGKTINYNNMIQVGNFPNLPANAITLTTSLIKDLNVANYGQNWQGLSVLTGLPTNVAYTSVSTSSTGQYMATCVSGGLVYLSSNYGNNWTSTGLTLPTTTGYPSIAVSSTGQYIVACSSKVYLSSNYGLNWLDLSNNGLPTNSTYRSISTSSTGQYMMTNFIVDKTFNKWTQKDSARNWRSISSSSTGQYMVACVYGGYLYTSKDYGDTWTQKDSARNWYCVSMSSIGQRILACVYGGYVYMSTDYGDNWSSTFSVASNWSGVSISSTGQTMAIVVNSAYLFYSTDYGANWTQSVGAYYRYWTSISMSSTGKYILASSNGTSGPSTDNLYLSEKIDVWKPKASSQNWKCVSVSDSGQYMVACVENGYLYVSKDLGNSWTQRDSSRNWSSVTTSNGQYMAACVNGGYLYLSNDYGDTWTQQTFDTTRNWYSIAISGNQYMVACVNGGYLYIFKFYNNNNIYLSNDYGNSWLLTSGSLIFDSLSINSSGQYILAAKNGELVYLSNDYGQTWTSISSLTANAYYATSMSSTGQYMMTCVNGGLVWLSSNYGKTWASISSLASANYQSVSISSTGQYMTVGIYGGLVYWSKDFGQTWTTISSLTSANYSGITMSSTGQYMLTCVNGGQVYMSSPPLVTQSTTPMTGQLQLTDLSMNGNLYTNMINTSVLTMTLDPSNNPGKMTNVPYTNIRGYVGFSDMSGSYTNPSAKALVEINGTSGDAGPNLEAYSLFASGSILSGQNLVVASDKRIKTNILDVVDVSAIDVIRRLQPKRYNYIDVKSRGESPVWGFIAQEVGDVLDYAVNITTEYIPNVYADAAVNGNRIYCVGIRAKLYDPMNNTKMKLFNTLGQVQYVTIDQIIDDDTIKTLEWLTDYHPETWFVFGQQIYDFNALDKMAIYTIATAALQELYSEYLETKKQVAYLQGLLERLLGDPSFNNPV